VNKASRYFLAITLLALLSGGVNLAQHRGGGGGGGGGTRSSARTSVNQSGNTGANRNTSANRNTNANSNTNANRNTNINNNTNVNRNVNVNNNVNVNRNVDVNVNGGYYGGYGGCCYHPVATAAAVTATAMVTAAVIGSIVNTIPPSCSAVVVNGVTYQQCGSTWYQPQFVGTSASYVVVAAPR
jgi:hypothetical protein